MNKRLIWQMIGKIMTAEAILMLLPAGVAAFYGEYHISKIFITVSIFIAAICLPLALMKVKDEAMYARDGFVLVSLVWILWSLAGAFPAFLSKCIPNYIDAVFEIISGFTTTGSTIIRNVEILPKGILFWRSFSHWVGGMGVLLFVMALVSVNDNSSMYIMRAELPGPSVGKLVPKGKGTAKILYSMYLALTVMEIILLLIGGMPVFDSVIHAFGTAGTGGLSIKNASISAYNSAYIDGVITVFMLLFSVNFNLYFFLLAAKVKYIWKNTELKFFLGLVATSIIIVMINILPIYHTVTKSFRYASFQVATVLSTTGYTTADFNTWPEFSKAVLLMLMTFGACAGSTGGGFKLSRVIIVFKSIVREVKKLIQPKIIRSIKMDNKAVDEGIVLSTTLYLSICVAVIAISTILVSLDNFDFTTTFSAVIASFNNIGPGFNKVGPSGNYADFSYFSKIILSLDMLLGRLEIFPIIMLFMPFNRKRNIEKGLIRK